MKILLITLLAACGVARGMEVAAEPMLWYTQPAAKWTEALPIGSGRLGAMVFGGTTSERIQFNEDTLWRGHPHDYVRAGAGSHLAELRRLLLEGKSKAAETLARDTFIGDPKRQMPYQPFGDVRLTFRGHDAATNYRRELLLDSAIARTSYQVGGVAFTRDVFASYPDNVIAVRLTADRPGQISFTVALTSPHVGAKVAAAGNIHSLTLVATRKAADHGPDGADPSASSQLAPGIVLNGQLGEDGLRYEARLMVRTTGGTTRVDGTTLVVENADDATLLLVAATSFKNFQDISGDPAARCAAMLSKLSGRDYADLLATHQADHRALFRRVAIDLGHTARAELPTNERVLRVKADGLAGDPALAALHFQYGRYLLIASSRPGTQPANLQGVWNEELNPPWESKFTTNINFEMNYWPSEVTGLSECAEPMFDLIDDVRVSGARTAKAQYGARGWVLHHNTDLWRGTAPVNNIDGVWTTGGAWLCHQLWEHYLFTGDREFLARRAYPVMKDAALFFIDTLVVDPKTGLLVCVPSYSPEQGNLTVGATMDHQIIRALFDSTIEAAKVLGTDAAFAVKLAQTRARLTPNLIGRHGQLQEWREDVDEPNNRHRHMSPLFAMFPGSEITPDDPKLWAAAKVLLGWRGDGDTGWSFAWRMPLWARAGDGDMALRQLQGLLTRRTLPNLFDLCGPFQIDGNFGACAGVAEMLLQSHRRADLPDGTRRHVIELLPALPKAWAGGEVRGLRARGGFEVAMKWDGGRLTRVELQSKNGAPCVLRFKGKAIELNTTAGSRYAFDGDLAAEK